MLNLPLTEDAMKYIWVLLFSGSVLAQGSVRERDYQSLRSLFAATQGLSHSYLRCASAKSCRAIPLGQKPCGGPSEYLVASVHNRNFSEILYLAERTKIREQLFNQTYGEISDCEFLEPPVLECRDYRCSGSDR
jgi:hypothetical protein